jgi:hypothetical protein
MAYDAITSGEADANSPADAALWGKVKGNFDDLDAARVTNGDSHDHVGGDGGALPPTAQGGYTAGGWLLITNAAERTTVSAGYVKLKEIKIGRAGTYRIKFTAKGVNSTGWAKIYKNGSPVGTERIPPNNNYTEYSEDISGWVVGDLVQVYGHGNGSTIWAYIKDLKLEVSTPDEPVSNPSY